MLHCGIRAEVRIHGRCAQIKDTGVMTAIVRLALSRPYTFVVMAILILIFGALSAIRTPTDIFPNIGIPVISVVWSYTGLPPDDMSNRILSGYERSLSTTPIG